MTHNWFECRVKFEKTMEDGSTRKVTEPYVFDALSFTEAEARVTEEMTPYVNGEFIVSNIKRKNVSEVFFSNNPMDDKWFKAKVSFVSLDESTGAERKSNSYMLVQANNISAATDNLKKGMEGSMADYEIASLSETKIMDVYAFSSNI